MTPRIRSALSWLTAAALVVAGWLIVQAAPGDDVYWETFYRNVSVGEDAEIAMARVSVLDIRAAEAVSDSSGWESDVEGSSGNDSVWILLDLRVEGRYTSPADDTTTPEEYRDIAYFATDALEAGGDTFSPSERPQDSFGGYGEGFALGKAKTGTYAYEVPASVLDLARARVVLAQPLQASMQEAIAVEFDPRALELRPHAEVLDTVEEPAR